VNTLKTQLIFLSKHKFFNLFEFLLKNPLKNQYLPHLSSENCEVKLIKSDSSRAFPQQRQEHFQISKQFSVLILSIL
jgi:hypothetical protein